ncbi:MAG: lytic transglycosylase domain-containing protein [Myxococcales bacterium]|nr:lytic transglycosylase domain-containing protein [Myxococcales bacterium]
MRKLARWAQLLSRGCGVLPLLAAFALSLSPRPASQVKPVEPAPLPADYPVIDSVLARRAPELGLILRQQLAIAIAEESRKAGYDPLLAVAVIDVESDFDEAAVSPKGARGLMQIKPSTLYFLAEKEGLRLSREEVESDPALCVRLGIRYLRSLHDRFGELDLALMAYNAGPARIREATKAGELDFFRRYPALVRRDFRRLREGEGLGGDWALALRTPAER